MERVSSRTLELLKLRLLAGLFVAGVALSACSSDLETEINSQTEVTDANQADDAEAEDEAENDAEVANLGCVIDLAQLGAANSASSLDVLSGSVVLEHRWDSTSSQLSPVFTGYVENLEAFKMDEDYAARFENPNQYSFADFSDTARFAHLEPGTEANLYTDSGRGGQLTQLSCEGQNEQDSLI